jgi:hypothetical protein
MKPQKLIFTILLAISIFIALAIKIMSVELNGVDKSANLILVFLILITILTVTGIGLSYNIQPTVKRIIPEKGQKGTRGMRGKVGEDGKCGLKCNDNTCYRKILDHISNVYNIYCEINGLQKLRQGHHIENKYIRQKVQQICKSQILSNLVREHGNHKLNLHGVNNIGGEKCDINSNCGAYDYIFQKWTEWILIILKYRNGKRFLDTENFTDNNFNAMITKEDTSTKVVSNKNWVFDLGTQDCYKNESEECLSFLKIVEPDTDKELQKKLMKRFRNTDFYKFYSTNGVPDAFTTRIMSLTEEDKITKLKSPFEEIGEYDAWYWGTADISKPRIIYKCNATDDYQKVERKSVDTESPKIKIRFTNDYYHLWSSKEARQAKINYKVNWSNSRLSFVPNLQKGTTRVNIYRPRDFYDSSETDPDFQSYKPLGDIIVPEDSQYNKTQSTEMYPKYKNKINDRKSTISSENGPKLLSVMVSGPDTRLPDDFELMYRSIRKTGFNAGREGFAIWRPIPPEGYVCLGDVIHRSPNGEKPNRNIVRCIPEVCVERISTQTGFTYGFKTPDSIRDFNGNTNVIPQGSGQIRDTDVANFPNAKIFTTLSDYNPKLKGDENSRNRDASLVNQTEVDKVLSSLNLFRCNSNGVETNEQFFKIKYQYLYNLNRFMIKDKALTLVPKEKHSKEYSILKIYDN